MKSLNISDVVGESWQLLSNHYLLIGGTFVVYFFLSSVGSALTELLPEDASILIGLISWVDLFFSYFLLAGFYQFGLNLVQERNPALGDLFSQSAATTMRLILATLLVGLVVVVGLILLIIPGIILALKYSMVIQLVVDRQLGPLEAMSQSAKITNGNMGKIFLLGLANFGIILLGVLCLGVGLIVAIPLTWLTLFVAYEMLKSSSSNIMV